MNVCMNMDSRRVVGDAIANHDTLKINGGTTLGGSNSVIVNYFTGEYGKVSPLMSSH